MNHPCQNCGGGGVILAVPSPIPNVGAFEADPGALFEGDATAGTASATCPACAGLGEIVELGEVAEP